MCEWPNCQRSEDGTVPAFHVETVYTDITPNEDMSGYL